MDYFTISHETIISPHLGIVLEHKERPFDNENYNKKGFASNGKMRIHCLENVERAINFLINCNVHMENVGSHDIVDGNQRITLGLIWTIILRFHIQEITFMESQNYASCPESLQKVQENKLGLEYSRGIDTNPKRRYSKDALMLWCKVKTANYPNVNISNFSSSWTDGVAFNALIHRHSPKLLNYSHINPENKYENLEKAFSLAERYFSIPRYFDPEDILKDPDERSIITYLSAFYHAFNKRRQESVNAKKIGKLLDEIIQCFHLISNYEMNAKKLIEWIYGTLENLNKRNFSKNSIGLQQQLVALKNYILFEKSIRFMDQGNLEIDLFEIRSRLIEMNLKIYQPPPMLRTSAINNLWSDLDIVENKRENSIRMEILRVQRLDQLSQKFFKKANLRQNWLEENTAYLKGNKISSFSLDSVYGAMHRQHAFENDLYAYSDRIRNLTIIAEELDRGKFYKVNDVFERLRFIDNLWNDLIDETKRRRDNLDSQVDAVSAFGSVEVLMKWMQEIELKLRKNLNEKKTESAGVESELKIHEIIETDIRAVYEVIINKMSQNDARKGLKDKQDETLRLAYTNLVDMANARRGQLDKMNVNIQISIELNEMRNWLNYCNKSLDDLVNNFDADSLRQSEHRLGVLEKELASEGSQLRQLLEENKMPLSEDNKVLIERAREERVKIMSKLAIVKHRYELMTEVLGYSAELDEWENYICQRNSLLAAFIESPGSNYKRIFQLRDDVDRFCRDTLGQLTAKSAALKTKVDQEFLTVKSFFNALPDSSLDVDEAERMKAQLYNLFEERNSNIKSLLEAFEKQVGNNLIALENDKLIRDVSEDMRNLLDYVKFKKVNLAKIMENVPELRDLVKAYPEDLDQIMETLTFNECRVAQMEKCLKKVAQDVGGMNETVRKLDESPSNPSKDGCDVKEIYPVLNCLNDEWNELADIVENNRYHVKRQIQLMSMGIDLLRANDWAMEKVELLRETDQIDIITYAGTTMLQKKLRNIRRDITALESRITDLNQRLSSVLASLLDVSSETRKDYSNWVLNCHDQLMATWTQLGESLETRCQRLCQGGKDQNYAERLGTFKDWTIKMLKEITVDPEAVNLGEAERKLLHQRQCHKEIEERSAEAEELIRVGEKITLDSLDPHHLMLMQTIREMQESWHSLVRISHLLQDQLQEKVYYFVYQKLSALIDVLLSQQESALTMVQEPVSSYLAQEYLAKTQTIQKSLESIAGRLKSHNQQATAMTKMFPNNKRMLDDLEEKSRMLKEKFERISNNTKAKCDEMKDKVIHFEFIDKVDEFLNWIKEKEDYVSKIKSLPPDRRKNAFFHIYEELKANEECLENIFNNGRRITDDNEKLKGSMGEKAGELQATWKTLLNAINQEKTDFLDENREDDLRKQIYKLTQQENKISIYANIAFPSDNPDEEPRNMSLIELTKTSDVIANYEEEWKAFQTTYKSAVENIDFLINKTPMREFELNAVHESLKEKYNSYQEILERLKSRFGVEQKFSKLMTDLTLEQYWANDKLAAINLLKRENYKIPNDVKSSTADRVANSLRYLEHKKNSLKSHCGESDNRRPRVSLLIKQAEEFAHENKEKLEEKCRDLLIGQSRDLYCFWEEKIDKTIKDLHDELTVDTTVHEFIQEANEAEAWILEKDLLIAMHEKPVDEEATIIHRRKHTGLHKTIEEYSSIMEVLDRKCSNILEKETDDGAKAVKAWNDRIQTEYKDLLNQSSDIGKMLGQRHDLFQVMLELESIEIWLVDCHEKAKDNEIDNDLEQCNGAFEKFKLFCEQTMMTGNAKITGALDKCELLILNDHPESDDLHVCKERITDLWQELQELMRTRISLLKTARDLQLFLVDCEDMEEKINTRRKQLPDIPPESSVMDQSKLEKSQRLHYVNRKYTAVVKDIDILSLQMNSLGAKASDLLPLYSDNKLRELSQKIGKTTNLWKNFLKEIKEKRDILLEYSELNKFFLLAADHLEWLENTKNDMERQTKPRDVSGVACLINDHRTLRYEIKSKSELIEECLNLGRQLLPKENADRKERIGIKADVREKCVQLATGKLLINELWRERWDRLQILYDIRLFAKDSDEADALLNSVEIKLTLSRNKFGNDISETLTLLGAQNNLERSLKSAEERFENLKRLTAIEVRSMEWNNSELVQRENDKRAKVRQVIQEFLNMPTTTQLPPSQGSIQNRNSEVGFESPMMIRKPLKSLQNIQNNRNSLISQTSNRSTNERNAYDHRREPIKVKSPEEKRHDSPLSQTASITLPHSDYLNENSDVEGEVKPMMAEQESLSSRSKQDDSLKISEENAERKPRAAKRRSKLSISSESSRSHEIVQHPEGESKEPAIRSITSSPLTDYGMSGKNSRSESVPAPAKRISLKNDPGKQETSGSIRNQESFRLEGPLARKQITERGGSKRSRSRGRNWNSVYLALDGGNLAFYKDQRTRRERPSERFHNEEAIPLSKVSASVASDYVKRPCVFKLSFSDGTVYLLQAATESVMLRWITVINEASSQHQSQREPDDILSETGSNPETKLKNATSMRDIKSPSSSSRQSLRKIFKK